MGNLKYHKIDIYTIYTEQNTPTESMSKTNTYYFIHCHCQNVFEKLVCLVKYGLINA